MEYVEDRGAPLAESTTSATWSITELGRDGREEEGARVCREAKSSQDIFMVIKKDRQTSRQDFSPVCFRVGSVARDDG